MTIEEREKEDIKVAEKKINCITIAFIGFIIGVAIACLINFINIRHITPPVEEIVNSDSLIRVNNNIKIEIEHLDSVKNEKIIKVKTLDNDSTLRLFYQLISK